jgi:hypothetical protein
LLTVASPYAETGQKMPRAAWSSATTDGDGDQRAPVAVHREHADRGEDMEVPLDAPAPEVDEQRRVDALQAREQQAVEQLALRAPPDEQARRGEHDDP